MKIVIIGGGPGGYSAALRAAKYGADVTIIEKKAIGGTCLNKGCIPTKVLLHAAELYEKAKNEFSEIGIEVDNIFLNWKKLLKHKETTVSSIVRGVRKELESQNIRIINGTGVLQKNKRVAVYIDDALVDELHFDYCILATGSKPIIPKIKGVDHEGVLFSNSLLSLEHLPNELCIVGGGVIGLEFASLFSRFGSKVTVIEMDHHVLAKFDRDATQYLEYKLQTDGVRLLTNSGVQEIIKVSNGYSLIYKKDGKTETISTEQVLVAVGRMPNFDYQSLLDLGVVSDRKIQIDSNFETPYKSVYAIGDCKGGHLLAHAASAEGEYVIDLIHRKNPTFDLSLIPNCIYTKPEIASIGLTEKEAIRQGYIAGVDKIAFNKNGKAIIENESEGIVKMVYDRITNEILGLTICGPKATELIMEGTLAMHFEATCDEMAKIVHPHPTISEIMMDVFRLRI